MTTTAPLMLPPNPVFRFYRGGPGIDRLRGLAVGTGPGAPEDWVGSTTTSLGQEREGLATLADGELLREVINQDPVGYLGAEHVERFGANPGLLVKLLDAGERLAVHFHPGRPFAREHMGLRFGKTEAWVILAAEAGAHMNLGLRAPIDMATLQRWVREQDTDGMLAALHEVPVQAGDVLFVPAGTLHTIGSGITLIELQEPSDMSVVLEWQHFRVTGGEEHLNLGWDLVLNAAVTDPTDPIHGGSASLQPGVNEVRRLLPELADPYFRAECVAVDGEELALEPSFAVLVVADGEVVLTAEDHEPLQLRRGAAALVPHGAGTTTFGGSGTVIRCLPPTTDSGEGNW